MTTNRLSLKTKQLLQEFDLERANLEEALRQGLIDPFQYFESIRKLADKFEEKEKQNGE